MCVVCVCVFVLAVLRLWSTLRFVCPCVFCVFVVNSGFPNQKSNKQNWHRIVVFGDSLSCGPQSYKTDFPDVPDEKNERNYGPRFSNGWTMVEYMRDALNIPTSRFHNFATGGETSDDMRQVQFPMFLEYKFDINLGNSPENAELYVIFGGSNDFAPFLMEIGKQPMKSVRQFVFGNLSEMASNLMDGTVERIIHVMENLYGCANARLFFVPNIPNVVSDYPLTKKIFTRYTRKLTAAVEKFQKDYRDTRVVLWNLSDAITDMQSNPGNYGFTNINLFKNVEKLKSPPDQTLFWDGAGHFTTKAHKSLAQKALAALRAEIPDVEVQEREVAKPWNCELCSFTNKPDDRRCDACKSRKSVSSPNNNNNIDNIDNRGGISPISQQPLAEWTCSVCTLVNPRQSARCQACESPHPDVLSDQRFHSLQSALISQISMTLNEDSPRPDELLQSPRPDENELLRMDSFGEIIVPEPDPPKVVAPSPEQVEPSTEWACPVCTFINPGGAQLCEICQTGSRVDIEPDSEPVNLMDPPSS